MLCYEAASATRSGYDYKVLLQDGSHCKMCSSGKGELEYRQYTEKKLVYCKKLDYSTGATGWYQKQNINSEFSIRYNPGS